MFKLEQRIKEDVGYLLILNKKEMIKVVFCNLLYSEIEKYYKESLLKKLISRKTTHSIRR